MARHVVAAVGEIPVGGHKVVNPAGREICVFNVNGEHLALINRCPHEGAALNYGPVLGCFTSKRPGEYSLTRPGEMLRCPWHGWEFDIRTGQSWCEPDKIAVRQYPVEATSGQALAQGPYVAETIIVSVEEQYIVVEV